MESMKVAIERQAALMDYLAAMTDVEIPVEDEEERGVEYE